MTKSRKGKRLRRWLVCALLALILIGVSGCQTLSFYSQAIRGQYQIFAHEKAIDKLLEDRQTPDRLKQRLELLRSLRTFAEEDLKLPVDGHYRKYVDVHRPFVVWNVEAAPEFSLEPKSWWYPMVGRLDYRGCHGERARRGRAEFPKTVDQFPTPKYQRPTTTNSQLPTDPHLGVGNWAWLGVGSRSSEVDTR